MNISDLTDHTGYWMRMVSNAVSQEFARKVSGHSVTVAEWVFLRALFDEKPASPTRLAKHMGMTKGAISKLSERLIAKGLVRRAGNADDKRAHSVSLTAKGRAKVPVLAALADDNDREFFESLTEDDRRTLRRILEVLAARRGLATTPIN